MPKIVCGIDCEVSDPLLKTAGYSWKYNEGYILTMKVSDLKDSRTRARDMTVYQIETRDKDYKSITITASYERTRKALDTT